ncbi:choice-of-anchor V domain-containing protein [Lewinella sp. LCG006]|uniref:T9SS type A sorting domain-containing protein n=1 Tax=Lewinella sp. LCG006 TaxID=3231911 RepID=UPI00345F5CDA
MRAIYMLFFVLSCGILFLGNSSGPGAVQGKDRTGGPLAEGFCGNCHAAGAFSPTMTLELLQNGTVVNGYEAGQSYTMRVTVNAQSGAQVYGFQAVALAGAGNDQAGSFSPVAGTQLTTLNGRDYIEHSQRSNSNVFEIPWTAPSTSAGEVKFYAATVAANNANGSGGDGAVFLTSPTVLSDLTVNTRELPALATRLNAFPNPVIDQLNLQVEVEATSDAMVRIYNMLGQPVQQEKIVLAPGTNNLSYDLSKLVAGQYTVEISNGTAASRTMVFKQ